MEEVQSQQVRWSSPNIGHIAGDLAAATISASLVTPAVAIIDRSVLILQAQLEILHL
jgi:hypothetical protein